MEREQLESVIEAVLFSAGDAVKIDTLSEIINIDKNTLTKQIDQIVEKDANAGRPVIVRKINDAYQLCSNPDYYNYTSKLFEPRQKKELSQAALETLSIIAYNPSITKQEIEKIRGVNSDGAVNVLVERELVKEAGRFDGPGRPIMYETTDEFLRAFGYNTLQDLPEINIEMEEQIS